jgi:hypothetical protein
MRHRLPAFALALFCTFPAVAVDLPTRKAGLWEIKTTLQEQKMPPQIMQQCVDAATDKLMNEKFGGGKDVCPKQDIRKSGSTIIAESSCKIGAVSTTTRAVYEGDFDSAYTVKVSTTQEGGPQRPQLPARTNMTIQAKWMGPCKPGQKPGDVEAPNGMKMNILELPKTPPPPQR